MSSHNIKKPNGGVTMRRVMEQPNPNECMDMGSALELGQFCLHSRADPVSTFTLSPESRASLCGANLPGDWALYVPLSAGLIALHSGFLWTVPRGSALAFG